MTIPGSANPLLLRSASTAAYTISRSLRFNSSDSAYLSRTPASAGNRKTWTWSGWVKRSALQSGTSNTYMQLFSAGTSSTARDVLFFDTDTDDTLAFFSAASGGLAGSNVLMFRTNAVFRDASAWYHIVLAVDTTQSTAANRVKLYVNGVEQTFSTVNYPSQNAEGYINLNNAHYIATHPPLTEYLSGYLADIHFIDGQALTPSSFGDPDANGVWQPKAYTGTYGTNGFRLPFSDNSNNTATTLGKDTSGNGNNWTPNNLSVTAGAGNDSLVDSPSSPAGQTDSGAGGTVVGNYCTWNPLDNGSVTLSNGNLDGSATVAWKNVRGTIAFPSSGKWYYEVTPGGSALLGVGIAAANKNLTDQSTGTFVTYNEDGRLYKDGSINASGKATYTSGDVIGVAFDCDTNSVTFYKNSVSQGSVTPTTGVTYFPFVQIYNSSLSANWGSRPFAYTAPSGFKALCTANLPTPTIANGATAMDVKLYTGNGSTQTISGLGFSSGSEVGLLWIKGRSGATDHAIYDDLRGAQLDLASNTTAAETTQSTGVTTLGTNSFAIGSLAKINTNSATYAAWAWAGPTSTSTNTQGSITSQVRANASAGFSVVTYTGTGANATVGHGLGVAAQMVIVKRRNSTGNWAVWHKALAGTDYLRLNSNLAKGTDATYWNSTIPTSTVFSIGTSTDTNANTGTYVAYCFTSVAGYSLIGNYEAGTEPFVFCDFRPRFIMIKRTASGDGWAIFDTSRTSYNVATARLEADASSAEGGSDGIDILSNGFKIKTTWGGMGGSTGSGTMAFMAFAESPFAYARAR